jgi:hypothetical protein
MKNLVKTFAIAFLLGVSFISNATGEINPSAMKSKTFEVGVYQSINTLTMNVMIEKLGDNDLVVILRDEKGAVLIKRVMRKSNKSYHGKYDMTDLADGKYTFEFIKGDEKITKEVNLQTNQPKEVSREISLD